MRVLISTALFMSLIISGCSPTSFGYQIVSTEPLNDETSMTFQNEDCLIEFDFWKSHGNPGFVIHNKSEDNIVLNLDSCFYIYNGEMRDLFLQREYSSSSSSSRSSTEKVSVADFLTKNTQSYYNLSENAVGSVGVASTNAISREQGQTRKEMKRLIISPGAKRSIIEYSILNRSFRPCNLQRDPNKRLIKNMAFSVDYSPEDSPLVFSTIINYSASNKTYTKRFSFYISRLENVKKDDVFFEIEKDDCGRRLWDYSVLKDLGEKKFYIRYRVQ